MEYPSLTPGPLKPLADVVWGKLGRELSYIRSYDDYVTRLEVQVKGLLDKSEWVEHEVEDARRNGKEIPHKVDAWLEDVRKIIAEYDKYQKHEDRASASCTNGVIANPWSRYHLSKTADGMSKQVKSLVGIQFNALSYQMGPTSMDVVLSIIGYESFKSRNETTERIMAALKDPTIRMIGIHGQGGVGKTTLVKQVARKARKDMMVLMVSVTRNPDLKRIQGELGDMLGLRFEEESVTGRADRLRERLKNEKKNILVILDDIWEGLDLKMLGISMEDDNFSQKTVKDGDIMKKERSNGDNRVSEDGDIMKKARSSGDNKLCKILLTSRSKDVLRNQMYVKENSIFPVKLLNEEEAERLLKKVAEVPDENSTFDSLATKIANKCGGLPMAIVTVAKTLRNNKNISNWSDALKQLESQEFTGLQEPMELSTKLSYDHLQNEELKSAFLLCARLCRSPFIMELTQFCVGLGIFRGVHTIREARNRVDVLVQKLKDSRLLLDSDSNDRFNMHDTVRDAALSITSKEQHVFSMKDCELDEWPDNNALEQYTSISLHYCDIITELPEGLTCPRLKLFHLESANPLLTIPDNFFKGMKTLRVLILTGIDLSHLPTSIKCLRNLRMLCLEQCVLGDDLCFIGKLKNLRILSLAGSKFTGSKFTGSKFKKLPNELGELGKLQLFDISNCSKVIPFQPNVISRLTRLEELYMRNSIIQYEVRGQPNQSENGFLAELSNLQQLKTLDICIPNVAVLPPNFLLDKLDSYKISIGDVQALYVGNFMMPDKYEASRALALQLVKGGNDIHSLKGIKLLFKRVQILCMGELNGVKNVSYQLNLEGFQYLKHLLISNNADIEYIINSEKFPLPQDAFPNLESLYLCKLERIEQICCSPLNGVSFHKLKSIKIMVCPKLKNLFSFHMGRLLKNLETIEVSECDSLNEIVGGERQEINVNDGHFPRLRALVFRSLATLTSFYMLSPPPMPNMEVGEITAVDEHGGVTPSSSFFSEEVKLSNLENLELSSIKIHNIWSINQSLLSSKFKNLMQLNVNDCNELKHLLSLSMAAHLVNLKGLFVSSCEMMEGILSPREISMNDGNRVDHSMHPIFPKLEQIHLTNMNELTEIWHAQVSDDSFSSLNSVHIKWCKKIDKIFPSHMVERLKSLDSLEVVGCESVKVIFELGDSPQPHAAGIDTKLRVIILEYLQNLEQVWNRDPKGNFNFKNLQDVRVRGCHILSNVLPASAAEDLEKLEELSVVWCARMKEIVAWEEGSETSNEPLMIPEVINMRFYKLPNIERFYKGRYTIRCPQLKQLVVYDCEKLKTFTMETTNAEAEPVFSADKVFPNLEFLGIDLAESKWIECNMEKYLMHRLKVLSLRGVGSIDFLYWFLHRIPNLESLKLFDSSDAIQELVPSGNIAAKERLGAVLQLKELTLWKLWNMKNIGFERDPVLQRVERLELWTCPNLESLAPRSVSFPNLTYLKVDSCDGLTHLMASSTAKSLVQLTTMKVIICRRIKEIVSHMGTEDERAVIEFSKLRTLELVTLESITSFCSSKKCEFRFPSLEQLIVRDCPKMETFTESSIIAPKLQNILAVTEDKEEKWHWEGDLNATVQKAFRGKLSFQYTETLELVHYYTELEQVWNGTDLVQEKSFRFLKELKVENCENLVHVIPSHLLPCFKNLEKLEVRRCRKVQVIFNIKGMRETKTLGIYRLERLSLDELPNLEHIWDKDPKGIAKFQALQHMHVDECASLKSLFPTSMAKDLARLERLWVARCKELVEIFAKDETPTKGATKKFVFHCLTSLTLRELPGLKYFYRGLTLECPVLEELDVAGCNSVIFKAQEAHAEEQILFPIEKVVRNPCLEKFSFAMRDTRVTWYPRSQGLKFEDLPCFPPEDSYGIVYEFLQMVPKIKKLEVGVSYFEEMFSLEEPDTNYIGVLLHLEGLKLFYLDGLKSIGLEHPWLHPIRENLQTLEVEWCGNLQKLVPSTVFFSNLVYLAVSECGSLQYLLTSSTAKSLGQLKQMKIRCCESMEVIVCEEGEESHHYEDEKIIFWQLQTLYLENLQKLGSFYSGNYTFCFLSLVELCITECRRVETFCPVIEIDLTKLKLSFENDGDVIQCKDDLNTTIRKMSDRKSNEASYKSDQSEKASDESDQGEEASEAQDLDLPFSYVHESSNDCDPMTEEEEKKQEEVKRDSLNWQVPSKLPLGTMDSNSIQCKPSSQRICKYDVFLSFGEDTRNTFADDLYDHLRSKGIFAFKNDRKLQKGELIVPQLLQAIQDCRVSVVIFSEDYANSTWCLEEMAAVAECGEKLRQTVLPIFYDMDPSEVRRHGGVYRFAFDLHAEKFKKSFEKVDRWRRAMKDLANLPGWVLQEKSRFEEIQKIVREIIIKLGHKFSGSAYDLVGIQPHVEELEDLLKLSSKNDDFQTLGIWGMDGIGKTTHAMILHDRISYQFDACYFLEKVSKAYRDLSDDGIIALQKQILSETLGEKNLEAYCPFEIARIVRNRLSNKKVLIVLDDVDESEQLKQLAIHPKLLGPGSRIIITTRDKHILKKYGVDKVYKVPLLNDDDAYELFSRKCFKRDDSSGSFKELIVRVLKYAQNLPLAVRELGLFLEARDATQWRNAFHELQNNPLQGIMNELQISLEKLKPTEREIFLHIACFFTGKREDSVKRILDCCELYPAIGISVLVEKSLITLENEEIHMHAMLQELGRKIAREESPFKPAELQELGITHKESPLKPELRSRLWRHEDFHHVIKTEMEEIPVEALVLDQEEEVSELSAKAFSKMRDLSLLILHHKEISESLIFLSNKLQYLSWHGYPFTSLPSSFEPDRLVELNMPDSRIEHLWEGIKYLPYLRRMDLSNCKALKTTPDFSEIQNLERLDLTGCINLTQVHPSVSGLGKLAFLSLRNCSNLICLIDRSSTSFFSSLKFLDIGGCTKLYAKLIC